MVETEVPTRSQPPSFAQNCIVINPSILFQNPFHTPLKLNLVSPNLTAVRDSVASRVDKWLRCFHGFVSQNPVFVKILALSSAWSRRFNHVMIQCRKNRNENCVSNHSFAAILPGDSVAGVVVTNGILNFLNIYNTLLIVRLVLTWFPNSPPAIVSPLSTLCDPYLNIFRGIIPPLGGLDLSPILAFLVLNVFTSTAAALPAELPKEGSCCVTAASSCTSFFGLTASQEKWLRRLQGKKSRSCSNGAN